MTYRTIHFTGFLICFGLLIAALYFQYVGNLEPCPLCIFQRFVFSILGLLFILATLLNPVNIGRKIFAFLISIGGLVGVIIAGRHIWLQHLPADEVPSCGPGLEYMLSAFPLQKVVEKVFSGSGECAEVDWTFLGLSMPSWSLIWFVILVFMALRTTAKSKESDTSSFGR